MQSAEIRVIVSNMIHFNSTGKAATLMEKGYKQAISALHDWLTPQEAQQTIKEKAGKEISLVYLRKLASEERGNKIRTKVINAKNKLYYRPDVENWRPGGPGRPPLIAGKPQRPRRKVNE